MFIPMFRIAQNLQVLHSILQQLEDTLQLVANSHLKLILKPLHCHHQQENISNSNIHLILRINHQTCMMMGKSIKLQYLQVFHKKNKIHQESNPQISTIQSIQNLKSSQKTNSDYLSNSNKSMTS